MKRIFALIFAIAIPFVASADNVTNLMGLGMPAQLASQVDRQYSSAIAASSIPATDNTYDLGSTSKTWRTLYTGTSRIAKTSDILRVRQDAQRLFTWDASSDTAFTQLFGDGGTTALQTWHIGGANADADDDSTVTVGAGSAYGDTRSGGAKFQGNEIVSTGGSVDLLAGNVSTAKIRAVLEHGSSTFVVTDTTSGDVFTVTNAGAVTSAAGITATTGDVTSTAGKFIASTLGQGAYLGAATKPSDVSGTSLWSVSDVNTTVQGIFQQSTADANGPLVYLAKTRNTDNSANTIVQNGDALGKIFFYGADGVDFRAGAAIAVNVSAAPGVADMPSSMDFLLSPDGSATPASVLLLNQDKSALFTGTVRSSATSDIGWTPVSGANTACNTTCTSACVTGIDTLGTGGFLACTDATADHCLCAGAS